jgi:probable addiction module antidote protein
VESKILNQKISKPLRDIGRTTMPKRTGDFNAWHIEKLSDPTIAANYLSKVWNDSRHLFLDAVKDVIQARQVSSVAKRVGVKRESLYRSFSSAAGNPTWTTMQAVLGALGVEFPGVQPIGAARQDSEPPASAGTKKRRGRQRRTCVASLQQLSLPLSNPTNAVSVVGLGGRPAAIGQADYANSRPPDVIREIKEMGVKLHLGFMLQQQQGGTTSPSFWP